jgi:hypothetical protein
MKALLFAETSVFAGLRGAVFKTLESSWVTL